MDKNVQRAIEEIVEKQRKKMEEILQAFQKDIITYQSKVNVLWNTMNVFIKVLTTKQVVTTTAFDILVERLLKHGHLEKGEAEAILSYNTKSPLVSEQDFVDAGSVLIQEARENVEKARSSAATGIPVRGDSFKKVPIEETTEWMQRVHAEEKARSGSGTNEPS